MFVAMFSLLMATVLIANVSSNFDRSLRSVEATEFRYLSFAATNELLSDLGGGLELDTFSKDHPRRVETDGRVTESWVELLEEGEKKNVFVVAKTYRQSVGQPEVVRRLATYHENTRARVYTNAIDTDTDTADPIFFNDISNSSGNTLAWDQLPPLPRTRYTATGTLETKPGENAGTIPYITGSPDGSLYTLYSPTIDGWGDPASPAYFLGIPIPISLRWGDFARNTIVNGGQQGMTVGDLAPVPQVLINSVVDQTAVSKGALFMKYSHENNDWTPLPPAEEAAFVGGQFVTDPGNYALHGVAGPPVAHDGGLSIPLFRKGQDSIYRYSNETSQWSVLKPPGRDVLLMANDQNGTPIVQTGNLQPVGPLYLLDILAGNLLGIYPNTNTSALHKYEDGQWSALPNPPAKFFNKSGGLVNKAYPGSRGPLLSGMVGGKPGEFFVVNRPPSSSGLVDTIYKYSDGAWELVPSPPDKSYDSSGNEVSRDDLPSRLEACVGSDGQLIIRVPNEGGGLDGIFVQDEKDKGEYDLLAPIQAENGSFQQFLSQMSVGKRRNENGRGAYSVRATYF